MFAALVFAAIPDAHAETLERCVERNTVRYSDPSNSALGQYFDLEAACRSAIDGDVETGFTLTPDPAASDPAAETPDRSPPASAGAGGETTTPRQPDRRPAGPRPSERARDGDRGATPRAPSVRRDADADAGLLVERDVPVRAVVGHPVLGGQRRVLAAVAIAIVFAVAFVLLSSRVRRGPGAREG